MSVFVVDCNSCRAKVAAAETGRAERFYQDNESGERYGQAVCVGKCPNCSSILVGETIQLGFEGWDADDDYWSDFVRVFPNPPRTFSSHRIPKVVTDSLLEADRSLQANANIAATVMLGRALEALCRDMLDEQKPNNLSLLEAKPAKPAKPVRRVMLGEGLRKLREKKIIDDRLYQWSQQLQAFRNLAAHPDDISISRVDAGDLQTFVNAIIEYVYDLTDRYEDFKERVDAREQKKKSKGV